MAYLHLISLTTKLIYYSPKNFHNSPESELTKPPKDTYVSFVSSNSKESGKKFDHTPEPSKISGLPSVSFVSSVSEENKKISDIEAQQIGAIRAWLFRTGEPAEDHDLVLGKCRSDPAAMIYFLKHANGEFDHAQ